MRPRRACDTQHRPAADILQRQVQAMVSWVHCDGMRLGTGESFGALGQPSSTLVEDGQKDAARPYLERFVQSAPPAFYAKDIREFKAILEGQPRR